MSGADSEQLAQALEQPTVHAVEATPLTADVESADGEQPSEQQPAEPPFFTHVRSRTIVLPEFKVLFLPIPKAGCTSILWTLASLAGLTAETFETSPIYEATQSLGVHDMSRWPQGLRLSDYDDDARERILTDTGWFRFTLVRHPADRLWSAWQSKLLLREPRFQEKFGDQAWFPRVPQSPPEIVEDFRRFVAALDGDDPPVDVHWAVQNLLVEQLPFTHIGRVSDFGETLGALREHLGRSELTLDTRRVNRSPLPVPPHLYDGPTADLVDRHYAEDFLRFGYEPVVASDDRAEPEQKAIADWETRVEPLLPIIGDVIDRHARIGQLHRFAQTQAERRHAAQRRARRARAKVETLEQRVEQLTAARRKAARVRPSDANLSNLERNGDFDVHWAWADGPPKAGMTAVVRVKNEARNLPWVLPPLLRATERVVLVDNGSDDGTGDVARSVARDVGAGDRLDVYDYPFAVSRCGPEHLATPANSLHSLSYFYNWCFSHVRTSYSLKWDGDMLLTDGAVEILRDLGWQLHGSTSIVRIPRHPLYVVDDRTAYLDASVRNHEPWGWPNRRGFRFDKAMEWELPLWPPHVDGVQLPAWMCVELKHLDTDEFAHWSIEEFDASPRTARKNREREVFRALSAGRELRGLVAVEPPDARHVIDYVREEWLTASAERLAAITRRYNPD